MPEERSARQRFPSERYAVYRRRIAALCRRLQWDVRGLERLPASGPVVLAMNHTGWEEILFATLIVPRPLACLGFRELAHLDTRAGQDRVFASSYGKAWGPFRRFLFRPLGNAVGSWARRVLSTGGFVPIDVPVPGFPPTLGRDSLRIAVERLRDGHALLVFPEGGYHRSGVMAPFKPGIGLLARSGARAGLHVPILPVAQWTAESISPLLGNRYVPRVRIGEPVFWSENEVGSAREQIERFAADLHARVEALLETIRPRAHERQ